MGNCTAWLVAEEGTSLVTCFFASVSKEESSETFNFCGSSFFIVWILLVKLREIVCDPV